jgi:chromosome partitioning protein
MIEQTQEQVFGLENPTAYFDEKNDEGNVAIAQRRKQNRRKGQTADRPEKFFKAIEASKLIGRSKQWLRDNDPDAPKDSNGHSYWTLTRINEIREKAGTLIKRPEGADPIVLAFSKLKGGVGNTTACAHFAHYCAMMGLKVLAMDIDSQSTLSHVLAGLNPDLHLDEDDVPSHALESEPSEFKDIIRETYFPNVYLAPCNSLLRNLEAELTLQAFGYKEQPVDENGVTIQAYERLAYAIKDIKHMFDVIVIDCPPNLNLLTMNGLFAADGMINVLRPNGPDMASYTMFMGTLANYYEYHPRSLRYFRILVSQYQNNGGCNEVDLSLRQLHGRYVLHNKVAVNAEINRAMGLAHTVFSLYKPESTREAHNKGKEIMSLACGEILNDIRALWEMEAEH